MILEGDCMLSFQEKLIIFLKKFLLPTGVVGHEEIALVYLGLF